MDQQEREIQERDGRISQLERAMCDVYTSLLNHDYEGAKVLLLESGALPR